MTSSLSFKEDLCQAISAGMSIEAAFEQCILTYALRNQTLSFEEIHALVELGNTHPKVLDLLTAYQIKLPVSFIKRMATISPQSVAGQYYLLEEEDILNNLGPSKSIALSDLEVIGPETQLLTYLAKFLVRPENIKYLDLSQKHTYTGRASVKFHALRNYFVTQLSILNPETLKLLYPAFARSLGTNKVSLSIVTILELKPLLLSQALPPTLVQELFEAYFPAIQDLEYQELIRLTKDSDKANIKELTDLCIEALHFHKILPTTEANWASAPTSFLFLYLSYIQKSNSMATSVKLLRYILPTFNVPSELKEPLPNKIIEQLCLPLQHSLLYCKLTSDSYAIPILFSYLKENDLQRFWEDCEANPALMHVSALPESLGFFKEQLNRTEKGLPLAIKLTTAQATSNMSPLRLLWAHKSTNPYNYLKTLRANNLEFVEESLKPLCNRLSQFKALGIEITEEHIKLLIQYDNATAFLELLPHTSPKVRKFAVGSLGNFSCPKILKLLASSDVKIALHGDYDLQKLARHLILIRS